MKKLFYPLFFLAVFQLSASAQYEFGTYYIDANLNCNVSNNKTEDAISSSYKNNAFKVTPEIGYFINNNLALGIGFNYQNTFNSSSYIAFSSYSNGTLMYTLSPTISTELNEITPVIFLKYFYQATKRLSISLKASYSTGWGTYDLIQKYTKDPQGQETIFKQEKDNIQPEYLFVSPEVQYLITKKVGLQINFNGLGYVKTATYDNNFSFDGSYPNLSTASVTKSTQETTSFNINPSAWSFGLFVLLN